MIDALKSVRDISRICEEEMRDSNHMRDITHLYPCLVIRETGPFQHFRGTHIDGLVNDCGVSTALATAILQFSTEPSILDISK